MFPLLQDERRTAASLRQWPDEAKAAHVHQKLMLTQGGARELSSRQTPHSQDLGPLDSQLLASVLA